MTVLSESSVYHLGLPASLRVDKFPCDLVVEGCVPRFYHRCMQRFPLVGAVLQWGPGLYRVRGDNAENGMRVLSCVLIVGHDEYRKYLPYARAENGPNLHLLWGPLQYMIEQAGPYRPPYKLIVDESADRGREASNVQGVLAAGKMTIEHSKWVTRFQDLAHAIISFNGRLYEVTRDIVTNQYCTRILYARLVKEVETYAAYASGIASDSGCIVPIWGPATCRA